MPEMDPTHALMLFYTSDRGMGFHRDEGDNDGKGDEPVVSISLGNTSEFAVKHSRHEPARTVMLESGDAILFGGQVPPTTSCVCLIKCRRFAYFINVCTMSSQVGSHPPPPIYDNANNCARAL